MTTTPEFREPLGFGYAPERAEQPWPPAPLTDSVPAETAQGWVGPPPWMRPRESTTVWHGSPDTVGIWLLAALPAIVIVLQISVTIGTELLWPGTAAPPWVAGGAALVAAWCFAGFDAAALSRRGFGRPSILWMLLLPPLGYLIARGRRVRRAGGRAWPPELLFFGQTVMLAGIGVLLVAWIRLVLSMG